MRISPKGGHGIPRWRTPNLPVAAIGSPHRRLTTTGQTGWHRRASYDADGALIEQGLPNGLTARTRDEPIGEASRLSTVTLVTITKHIVRIDGRSQAHHGFSKHQ